MNGDENLNGYHDPAADIGDAGCGPAVALGVLFIATAVLMAMLLTR